MSGLGRLAPGPQRTVALPLLLLADDAAERVHAELDEGELFTWTIDADVVGVVHAIERESGVVEFVRVAVAEEHQGRGIGQEFLAAACAALGEDGIDRVILGTGACSVANLAFYQKAGFRMLRIERDHFTPANGYPQGIVENGIPLLDMVWFDRKL